MQRSYQFDQISELDQHEKSRFGVWSRDLTCEHLRKAVVQGIRRVSGKCRYCLTQGAGRILKVCRDLTISIIFLSEVNMKSRVLCIEPRFDM